MKSASVKNLRFYDPSTGLEVKFETTEELYHFYARFCTCG